MAEPVYSSIVASIVGFYRVMGWPIHVEGAQHVPTSGPAVLATNHIGYLDFTFVGYAARPSGRLVRFLAKKEVFDTPVAGQLMKAMGHIPVDRFGKAKDALGAAVEVLQAGEVIGMFPEGTISTSFVPAGAKTGAARMAMAANAPLIPGAVWGSQRLVTKGRPRNLQRGVAITVLFGPPIVYDAQDSAADVTQRLQTQICALVDRAATTYPQQPSGPSDTWWLPAHLGGTAPTLEESLAQAKAERTARTARRREERRRTRES